ncbi:MAG: hypothetical protein O9322_07970 [Beijerinckiaceae bacterium]|nr:hypothetical protein [Beijerinckiaceae bacterium]MCZ8299463.1 hypothetical protein [Beijerinckiaceae bacterium]
MPKALHKLASRRNGEELPSSTLPLFAWALEQAADVHPRTNMAARLIAKRFGFSPHVARLIAEQAGFLSGADYD